MMVLCAFKLSKVQDVKSHLTRFAMQKDDLMLDSVSVIVCAICKTKVGKLRPEVICGLSKWIIWTKLE